MYFVFVLFTYGIGVRTIETRLMPYSARTVALPVPSFEVEYQRVKRKAVEDEVENEADKPKTVTLAKRDEEMRGHTAFLTFAYKF
ncbi:hypothetical protein AaE_009044 [Aphanomyces astaci]|uniref:Uncharacterized protein n=1 Tax=Aphanomyces astaci TaxID=112090 RepID=A0A6A5A616_APHAT|nr:hypothetical protein AaE_009044 [Aphanomyces astaci]